MESPSLQFTFTLSSEATTALTQLLMMVEQAGPETGPGIAARLVAAEVHPQLTERVPDMIRELDQWLEEHPDLPEEALNAVKAVREGSLEVYEEQQFAKASGSEGKVTVHTPPEKMI